MNDLDEATFQAVYVALIRRLVKDGETFKLSYDEVEDAAKFDFHQDVTNEGMSSSVAIPDDN